jgi:hypothetical protein
MIRILFLFVGVGLLSMSAAMGIHPIKQGADAYVLSDEMSAVFTDPETAVLPDSLEGPGETDTPPGIRAR